MIEGSGRPTGAHIVLAVCGSIAAFKAASLASTLVQDGHDVRIVLTDAGARFVTPLTFEGITGHAVASDIWDEVPGSSRMGHIELARWAELLVVAPASANTLARLALGLASDLLGAVALSTTAKLVIAPAMETHMWLHPATQDHVQTLTARGATIVGPESGHLASGAKGEGRLADPLTIRDVISRMLVLRQSLKGKTVLVTAGPTYEPIDPVRFIGNRSSGKMGYAIAAEATERGADVILVTGPTSLGPPQGAQVLRVETAAQMRDAVLLNAPASQIIVMAAAVADFTPSQVQTAKIKRKEGLTLHLSPTDDIAAAIRHVAPHAFHIGFALETDNLVAKAQDKLRRKHQGLVVANEVNDDHNPFGSDNNRVVLVSPSHVDELPQMSKRELAARILDRVEAEILQGRSTEPATDPPAPSISSRA